MQSQSVSCPTIEPTYMHTCNSQADLLIAYHSQSSMRFNIPFSCDVLTQENFHNHRTNPLNVWSSAGWPCYFRHQMGPITGSILGHPTLPEGDTFSLGWEGHPCCWTCYSLTAWSALIVSRVCNCEFVKRAFSPNAFVLR